MDEIAIRLNLLAQVAAEPSPPDTETPAGLVVHTIGRAALATFGLGNAWSEILASGRQVTPSEIIDGSLAVSKVYYEAALAAALQIQAENPSMDVELSPSAQQMFADAQAMSDYDNGVNVPPPQAPPQLDDSALELARLVKQVRQLQKEYFATRERDVLIASKAAEKELDSLVAATLEGGDQ